MVPIAQRTRCNWLRILGLVIFAGCLHGIFPLKPALAESLEPAKRPQDSIKALHDHCNFLPLNHAEPRISTEALSRCVKQTIHALCGDDVVAFLGFAPTITISNQRLPNAYAKGLGSIVITRGLFEQLQNSDELGFVLAHELGHLALHHNTKDPSALVPQQNQQQNSGHKRSVQRELDADHFAAEMMRAVGMKVNSGVNLLRRLQELAGSEADPDSAMPDIGLRIKDLSTD